MIISRFSKRCEDLQCRVRNDRQKQRKHMGVHWEENWVKQSFPPTLVCVHACSVIGLHCVGVCSENCSHSQCECDLDPGLLLKSARLQARHCVSHYTHTHTHIHCLAWRQLSAWRSCVRLLVNKTCLTLPLSSSTVCAWVCSFTHVRVVCLHMLWCHQVVALIPVLPV